MTMMSRNHYYRVFRRRRFHLHLHRRHLRRRHQSRHLELQI